MLIFLYALLWVVVGFPFNFFSFSFLVLKKNEENGKTTKTEIRLSHNNGRMKEREKDKAMWQENNNIFLKDIFLLCSCVVEKNS